MTGSADGASSPSPHSIPQRHSSTALVNFDLQQQPKAQTTVSALSRTSSWFHLSARTASCSYFGLQQRLAVHPLPYLHQSALSAVESTWEKCFTRTKDLCCLLTREVSVPGRPNLLLHEVRRDVMVARVWSGGCSPPGGWEAEGRRKGPGQDILKDELQDFQQGSISVCVRTSDTSTWSKFRTQLSKDRLGQGRGASHLWAYFHCLTFISCFNKYMDCISVSMLSWKGVSKRESLFWSSDYL